MFVIDLLLDDLADDVKHIGGWLFLIIACNLVLLLPVVHEGTERFGLRLEEKGTIAILAAIVLFLSGNILDIFVFPRQKKDPARWEKVVRDIMRMLALCGIFFALEGLWRWLAWACGAWAVCWSLHWLMTTNRTSKAQQRNNAAKGGTKERTGLTWLESDKVKEARKEAERLLKIHEGEYGVAKSLAVAAEQYNWSRIYFLNEAAKFIRSTVVLALVAGVLLMWRGHWCRGALMVLLAPFLTLCYFRLKERHIIRLYNNLQGIVSDKSFLATVPANMRVFCWGGRVVHSVKAEEATMPAAR